MLSTAQDDVCSLVRFLVIELDQSTGECPEPAVVLTQNIQMFFSSRVDIYRPYSSISFPPQQRITAFSPLPDYSLVLEHAEQESGAVPPTIEHMLTKATTLSCGQAANHVWFIDFDTLYASLQVLGFYPNLSPLEQ